MKRISVIIALILAFAMVLSGCGKAEEETYEEYTGDFYYGLYHDEQGHWEGVKASEVATVCEYKGISISEEEVTPTQDDINTDVNSILSQYATEEHVTDAVVLDGDTVNIDYVGSVDGVEFDGGSKGGAGTDVTIGVTSYIDDFLEQLIGHVPGETFDVEVTFPDSYPNNTALEGKDAVFVTTINYIVKTVTPELTDENVETYLSADYDLHTANDVLVYVTENITKQNLYNAANEYLLNNSGVENVPEKVFEYQKLSLKEYYQQYADYYGVDLETFLTSAVGATSMDDIYTQYAADMRSSAVQSLIMQAIAEMENITISDADVEAFFSENIVAADIEEYKTTYGMNYLKMIVMQNKVLDLVIENAIVE